MHVGFTVTKVQNAFEAIDIPPWQIERAGPVPAQISCQWLKLLHLQWIISFQNTTEPQGVNTGLDKGW